MGRLGDLSGESSIIVDYDLGRNLEPEIILRDIENSIDSRFLPKLGTQIDFSLTERKYCVGYHVRDEYHEFVPCPDRNTVAKGFQCGLCIGRDVLIPCLACTGAQCSVVRNPVALCNIAPTSVYLVSFGSEMKVGVSIRGRIMKRWMEQGADWGIEVGYGPNGSVARLVEDEISRSMGITKSVRLAKKLESLGRFEPEPPEFRRLAGRCFDLVKGGHPDFQEGDVGPENLQPKYNLRVSHPPFKYDMSGSGRIKGEFLGMKGFLLLFQDEIPYVIDFRTLRGRLIGETANSEQLRLGAFA
jgi:hypothetical protein